MRYSCDYIGHDVWHVTGTDEHGGYWLLSTTSLRGWLADYFDPETVTEILASDTILVG